MEEGKASANTFFPPSFGISCEGELVEEALVGALADGSSEGQGEGDSEVEALVGSGKIVPKDVGVMLQLSELEKEVAALSGSQKRSGEAKLLAMELQQLRDSVLEQQKPGAHSFRQRKVHLSDRGALTAHGRSTLRGGKGGAPCSGRGQEWSGGKAQARFCGMRGEQLQ
jgi:hypothetical protein